MNLRVLLIPAALLCFAGQVHAEGLSLKGLSLGLDIPHGQTRTTLAVSYRVTPPKVTEPIALGPNPCQGGVETVHYTHAQHPEEPSRRFLNEDIEGVAKHCYLVRNDSPIKPFVTVGGMTNSQFGGTLFFGPGIKLEFPEVQGFTAYIGAKIPYVFYTLRHDRGTAHGPLPTAFVGFRYDITKTISIGAFKEWLPIGGVQIYGTTFSGNSAMDNVHRVPSSPWAPMETWSRPSVALELVFQF